MKNEAKTFLIKAAILVFPLCVLLTVYVWQDPFKVLRKHDVYIRSGKANPVVLNQGYVSVETFLMNYPAFKYDSFIFGNSRSRFYPVLEWKKYITATECFHFDASGESLYGIYKKFEFLDKRGVRIRNALIILDSYLLEQATDHERYLQRQHPLLTGESWISFQVRFLKAFFNWEFLFSYLDMKIRGEIQGYMGKTMDKTISSYDAVTNEVSFDGFEAIIARNRDDYYKPRLKQFSPQSPVEMSHDAEILDAQKEQLVYIKQQLDKNNTNYRIVISPLYYQKKINVRDFEILCEIFGRDKVFDFSGKNAITSNMYNYYEDSHYRPHVAKAILAEIYR